MNWCWRLQSPFIENIKAQNKFSAHAEPTSTPTKYFFECVFSSSSFVFTVVVAPVPLSIVPKQIATHSKFNCVWFRFFEQVFCFPSLSTIRMVHPFEMSGVEAPHIHSRTQTHIYIYRASCRRKIKIKRKIEMKKREKNDSTEKKYKAEETYKSQKMVQFERLYIL